MTDKCPKCGAEINRYACYASPSEFFACDSRQFLTGNFYQSDRCRIAELENAIKTHRAQKADDRCIEDDDRLYEALGDGIKCDRRVGDKEAMKHNCERFVDNRCEAGGWPTYVELEAEITSLKRLNEDLAERVAKQSELLSKRAEKKDP